MQTVNANIDKECNKTVQSNQSPNLESARRDSLREDGPAQVNFSTSPAESPAVASSKNNRRAETKNNTKPPPCVIYPKRGKGNAQSKPGKNMVSRPKRKGKGVGYARGRY